MPPTIQNINKIQFSSRPCSFIVAKIIFFISCRSFSRPNQNTKITKMKHKRKENELCNILAMWK